MSKKVWLAAQLDYEKYCKEALTLLRDNGFELILNQGNTPPKRDMQERIAPDMDAIVAGTEIWDEAILKKCPKLKIICRFGNGIDNIDISKASEAGVLVTNVKNGSVEAVSDAAICLMLDCLKGITKSDRNLRRGMWKREFGHTLSSRKIGLLGFGAIAQRLAEKLSGFGCDIYAYDKYLNTSVLKKRKITSLSFEELLQTCDIISIHLPLTNETMGLIGKEQLALMDDETILINTARGGIVDEEALFEKLKSGEIACYGTDVYQNEPAEKTQFTHFEQCVCTPHMAGAAAETFSYTAMVVAQTLIDYFNGNIPDNTCSLNSYTRRENRC